MKRRAIFFGVDDYANIPKLDCAVADAAALCDFFHDRAGYVTELCKNPQNPSDVTRRVASVRDGLEAGDLLVVFFAGHGIVGREGSSRLLCAAADPKSVDYDADVVKLEVLERMARGPQDTVLILDACQEDLTRESSEARSKLAKLTQMGISIDDILSGKVKLRGLFGVFGKDGGKRRDISLVPAEEPASDGGPRPADGDGQLAVLFSCRKGSFSAEFDGHGLFSKALLEELNSAADARLAVQVADPLRLRLNERMDRLAKRQGAPVQHAQIWPADRPIEIVPGEADGRDGPQPASRARAKPVETEDFVCATAEIPMRWCPSTTCGEWRDAHRGMETFRMGSPTDEAGRDFASACDPQLEETAHDVRLPRGFWLGQTPVTQRQWRALMGTSVVDLCAKALDDETPYEWSAGDESIVETFRRHKGAAPDADPARYCLNERDDAPIYYASWNDAMDFCARLTEREGAAGRLPRGYAYRLPTEAEWEYACRAGVETTLPNGEPFVLVDGMDATALDGIAWYGGNSFDGWDGRGLNPARYGRPQQNSRLRMAPRSVHGKAPNAWRLECMLGNVQEWCADWKGPYPFTVQTDPRGPEKGRYRIVRGGHWYSDAPECRPAARWRHEPGFRNWTIGFRVALAPVLQGVAP